ncbi:hypothetical protein RSOLAG22IIIB_09958 [Rhizoctonia solani]|uniref:Uncharacterized protein n=1 Tax=Rhizoctonia solani TaxID=456999 RepID=A0A0K6G0A5_9AGAM|nr:hypothetical protein RSOLAG22IIIB_09958 [Rhizoctonia solani]
MFDFIFKSTTKLLKLGMVGVGTSGKPYCDVSYVSLNVEHTTPEGYAIACRTLHAEAMKHLPLFIHNNGIYIKLLAKSGPAVVAWTSLSEGRPVWEIKPGFVVVDMEEVVMEVTDDSTVIPPRTIVEALERHNQPCLATKEPSLVPPAPAPSFVSASGSSRASSRSAGGRSCHSGLSYSMTDSFYIKQKLFKKLLDFLPKDVEDNVEDMEAALRSIDYLKATKLPMGNKEVQAHLRKLIYLPSSTEQLQKLNNPLTSTTVNGWIAIGVWYSQLDESSRSKYSDELFKTKAHWLKLAKDWAYNEVYGSDEFIDIESDDGSEVQEGDEDTVTSFN